MTQDKPNVVFMLGDNIGWGDMGCYGGMVPTPRIDALAAEGMRFKNHNIEVQCTPTRSAILSGRLPIRTGNTSVPLPGQGDYGLAPWEYTLGELFSDAGYATAAFGKWHVGDVEGRLPTDQGFDEWLGIRNTSDEAGYSAYSLFAESGYPMPKIWEGVAGSPVTEVSDFDLERARSSTNRSRPAPPRSSSGTPRPGSRSSPTSASRRCTRPWSPIRSSREGPVVGLGCLLGDRVDGVLEDLALAMGNP